jgi:hypothetical protein
MSATGEPGKEVQLPLGTITNNIDCMQKNRSWKSYGEHQASDPDSEIEQFDDHDAETSLPNSKDQESVRSHTLSRGSSFSCWCSELSQDDDEVKVCDGEVFQEMRRLNGSIGGYNQQVCSLGTSLERVIDCPVIVF